MNIDAAQLYKSNRYVFFFFIFTSIFMHLYKDERSLLMIIIYFCLIGGRAEFHRRAREWTQKHAM